MHKNIEERLSRLERMLSPESTCVVVDESGKEKEVPVDVLIQNIGRMRLVRMISCALQKFDELLNAAWEVAWNEQQYPPASE